MQEEKIHCFRRSHPGWFWGGSIVIGFVIFSIYDYGECNDKRIRYTFRNIEVMNRANRAVCDYLSETGNIPSSPSNINHMGEPLGECKYYDAGRVVLWPVGICNFFKGQGVRNGKLTFHTIRDQTGKPEKLVILPPFTKASFDWQVVIISLPEPPYRGKKFTGTHENVSIDDFPAKYGHLLKQAGINKNP